MMGIRVREHAGVLAGEKQVTLGKKTGRVTIHSWVGDKNGRGSSMVYIATGHLDEDGEPEVNRHGDEFYSNSILDREDFVEAILAVLPELVRKDWDGR